MRNPKEIKTYLSNNEVLSNGDATYRKNIFSMQESEITEMHSSMNKILV